MKKIFTLFFFFFISGIFSQRTFVPDDNFEQALIDKGYDVGPLDDHVLTSTIDTILELFLIDLDITNLTGIEDFSKLEHLQINDNNLTSLDVTDLWDLESITFDNNNINRINLSNNLKLKNLFFRNNTIEKIDVSNNTLLEFIDSRNNEIDSLDFSNNTSLRFIRVNDNKLKYLNVKNGNYTEVNIFNTTNNPDLECIVVDNINYSINNWTQVDNSTSFTDNEESCNPLPCNITVDELTTIITCQNFILPPINNGNYYTLSGGQGNQLNAGDIITSSQDIYIYNIDVLNINCFKESKFTIVFDCGVVSNNFPSFFTPNNDFNNDNWIVKTPKEIKEIVIYNRFGKILSKPNKENGWDGTYKGKQMPSDTYWYRIVFEDNSLKLGSVTLLR